MEFLLWASLRSRCFRCVIIYPPNNPVHRGLLLLLFCRPGTHSSERLKVFPQVTQSHLGLDQDRPIPWAHSQKLEDSEIQNKGCLWAWSRRIDCVVPLPHLSWAQIEKPSTFQKTPCALAAGLFGLGGAGCQQ